MRGGRAHHARRPREVEVHRGGPVGVGAAVELVRVRQRPARDVDDDVEPPPARDGGRHGGVDGRRVGEVAGHDARLRPEGLRRGRGPRGVDVGEHHRRSLGGQPPHDGGADAVRGARHERDASREAVHRSPSRRPAQAPT